MVAALSFGISCPAGLPGQERGGRDGERGREVPQARKDRDRVDHGQRPRREKEERPAAPRTVTITAFRAPDDPFDLPRSVTWVDQETLTRRNEASVLDALNHTVGVWVEKRTATTSDPVIRGLSGANLLALVDGDPLTTFWGEGGFAGDDMYGKVEAENVERIEVIRGPASVQYGANALGGVINFITRKPRLDFPEKGVAFGGRAKIAYDTVNEGRMFRLDAEAAVPDLRLRAGGTLRRLEDGQGGNGVGTLAPSGGNDLNWDLAGEYRLGEGLLSVTAQQVRRRGLARFYRPTQRNENDRTGVSLSWRSAPEDADHVLSGRFYYQWKEDRRLFLTSGDLGVAQWQTFSTDWTWRSRSLLRGHRLIAGAGLRLDEGQSPDDEQFTIITRSGTRTKAAPDQDWWNLGLFVRDEWECAPWLTLTAGLRFDRFLYHSRPDAFYKPPVGDPELDRLRDWQTAWTGGLGWMLAPAEEWRIGGSWSRGFRSFAPRFGITKHGFGVLVPSGLLDPVIGDSYELVVRHRSEVIESSLAGYYTNFDGFQGIVPGTFQGKSFYDFNGNGALEPDERVFVTVGNGRAIVYGVEWEGRVHPWIWWDALPEGLWLGGGFMWNYGRDLTNREPARHTHPARGLFMVGYEEPDGKRWYVDLTLDFVRRFTRVSPARLHGDVGYRRDPQDPGSPLLRPDGLPGYTTVDLHAGYRFGEHLRAGMALENLTNKNYRPAHSRMDAFGFNASFFVEASF